MLGSIGDHWRGLALFVALALPTATAWGDPPPWREPLTLEAALSSARQNSLFIEAARLRIGEAQGDLTGASLLLVDNPEVVVEAGPRIPGDAERDARLELSLGLEQRFETGGQRGHRIDRARAEVQATSASAADVQRVIDLAVATTFYDALGAEHRLRLLEEYERLARVLYDIARRRLDAGEGTPLDVSAARIRLAEAQRGTIATRADRKAAVVRLAELIGVAASTPLTLQGELPGDEVVPDPDVLVARAVASHPGLEASAHAIEAARATVALADAEAWPDIGVGVFYGHEEGDDIVTAGLRVPIPLFNRNQGERARARAARKRLVAERAALELSVDSEVRRAVVAYEEARSALRIYDADVLRAQEESLELLQRAFQAGQVGVPDVIVVQREVIEGRQGYLSARLALARARAALLASAGIPQTSKIQGVTP